LQKISLLLVPIAAMLASGCARGAESARDSSAAIASIDRARPGDVITLPAGSYGDVVIRDRQWPKQVIVDARAATFSSIVLSGIDGLAIKGGTIIGTGERSRGVIMRDSRNVTLADMTITGADVGVVLQGDEDIALRNMTLTRMLSDGMHLVMSKRILVDGTVCRDFTPAQRIFKDGELVQDAKHPDCIQGWSKPGTPPLSDIIIKNSRIDGDMQGISFFNHVKNGVDAGGFDRITIVGNHVSVTRPNGISINEARDSVVRDNDVRTIPGSVLARNGRPVRTRINVQGVRNVFCGNSAADRNEGGSQSCARDAPASAALSK